MKIFLKRFLGYFITLQNYVSAKLDKIEMLMILNEFRIERYQRKYIIKKKRTLKKNLRHFKTLSLFSRLILLILVFFFCFFLFFICCASTIRSRVLL